MIKELKFHKLAKYFPQIEGTDFDLFVDDIKKNGQKEPIILFDGEILDGINRYRACKKLDVEPKTKTYTGTDPLGYVISVNIRRRHLSESQRAMLATEMLPEFEKKAKERQGKRNDLTSSLIKDNVNKENKKKNKEIKHGTASEEAGKQFGVSASSVQRAKKIKTAVENNELPKETIQDIVSGKKTLNKVDVDLHAKRFVKQEKEKEAKAVKENKKLPNKHPKAVKDYLDFLKESKEKISLATILAKEGMFSPEAMQFVKRLHNQIKSLMDNMEEPNEE